MAVVNILQNKETDMDDWSRYKKEARTRNPELGKIIDEAEEISAIVGDMIKERHNLNLSQYNLADICNISNSSIARID